MLCTYSALDQMCRTCASTYAAPFVILASDDQCCDLFSLFIFSCNEQVLKQLVVLKMQRRGKTDLKTAVGMNALGCVLIEANELPAAETALQGCIKTLEQTIQPMAKLSKQSHPQQQQQQRTDDSGGSEPNKSASHDNADAEQKRSDQYDRVRLQLLMVALSNKLWALELATSSSNTESQDSKASSVAATTGNTNKSRCSCA